MPDYKVELTDRTGVEVCTLRSSDGAWAEIAPGFGCNCFAYGVGGEAVLEPVGFTEFQQKPTSYGIPLLFPFPNRIRDGRFTFQGRTFEVNPARHGFVRDKAWRIAAHGADNSAGAWLKAHFDARDFAAQILEQFPLPFQLDLTYRLQAGALELTVLARNTGATDMPAGFGIHPYFRKPARGTLTVPAVKRWELEESLPTGRLLNVSGHHDLRSAADVSSLQLDDIYTGLTADQDGRVRCRLTDEAGPRQTVVEFAARQFPQVVVYTPPAPRQAICVEPNTCPTDAFNLQARGIEAGVLTLRPNEEACFSVRIFTRAC